MRLIDADAIKANYIITSTTTNSLCHLYVSIEDISNAPTVDAVEVVRCKDCKWYKCDGCFFSTSEVEENDFCSYGEASDENQDN